MNSLEMDLRRAFFSKGFIIGFVLELVIGMYAGVESTLFQISIPIVSTFPYGTAWLEEYESGFVKASMIRSQKMAYILGKIAASAISGGMLQSLICLTLKMLLQPANAELNVTLFYMSGMLWALVASFLAAYSRSYYLAYGGSFVVYYFLIILYERYLNQWYCLSPWEWILPKHTWIFDTTGIVLLVAALCVLLSIVYYDVLRRCLENI